MFFFLFPGWVSRQDNPAISSKVVGTHARSCPLLAAVHTSVVSQPGKGQPAQGRQAMSGGSPASPMGHLPAKGSCCHFGFLLHVSASLDILVAIVPLHAGLQPGVHCCPTLGFLISGMLTVAEQCMGQILP